MTCRGQLGGAPRTWPRRRPPRTDRRGRRRGPAAVRRGGGRLSGLARQRPIAVAAVRASLQLTAVSAVLVAVVGSLWLSALFVLLLVGRPGGPPPAPGD